MNAPLLRESWETDEPLVAPVNAVINVQSGCNSKCVYCDCWQHPVTDNGGVETWLGIIPQLAGLGVREVVFSGGEPLMNAGLARIVRGVADAGMRAHVITNGILLTRARAQSLLEAGLTGLTVSVDSMDPEIYQSVRGAPVAVAIRALDVLESLREPRLYRAINTVVTRTNLGELERMVDEAERRGLCVSFQAYTSTPEAAIPGLAPGPEEEAQVDEVIGRLLARRAAGAPISTTPGYLLGVAAWLCRRALPDDFRCYAGFVGVNIDGARQVRGCWMMDAVGNAEATPVAEIWHGSDFRATRARMRKLDCPNCWLLCHTDVAGICREGRT